MTHCHAAPEVVLAVLGLVVGAPAVPDDGLAAPPQHRQLLHAYSRSNRVTFPYTKFNSVIFFFFVKQSRQKEKLKLTGETNSNPIAPLDRYEGIGN